jgi:hypothetical protein
VDTTGGAGMGGGGGWGVLCAKVACGWQQEEVRDTRV